MTFETFPNKAMGDLEQQNKKCLNCWFYHKGKHLDLDEDGIIRKFDGICSNLENINIMAGYVKSVFENDCCESYQYYMDVIKHITRDIDEHQKTLDNLGGNVETTDN